MPAKNRERQAAYNALRSVANGTSCGSRATSAAHTRGDGLPQPVVGLAHVAQISSAVTELAGAPNATHDLRAESGRLSRASASGRMRRIEPETVTVIRAIATSRAFLNWKWKLSSGMRLENGRS
ncbi:MAG: hypothetical protein NVS3B16_15440 [Vulcanimicrobiaceae bacterium]